MSTTLLKFSAPWCAPCRMMAPIVESVMTEFDNIKLESVNIDDDSDKAVEYAVRSVPTLIVLKNGEKVGSLVGSRTAEELREFLSNHS